MEYSLNDETLDYFVEYGVNVWNLDSLENKYEVAKKSIDLTNIIFYKKMLCIICENDADNISSRRTTFIKTQIT
jgi:hypothetical protein